MSIKGAISTGHPQATEAGAAILKDGGNAFDAILGGLAAACVCEPVLASLGGGGFLLAHPHEDKARLYDFFAQTPKRKRFASDSDFFAITADFGETTQDFQIGRGSSATPGVIKGIFEAHADLGHMPIRDVLAPAIQIAKNGADVTAMQAYLFTVVDPIYRATSEVEAHFTSPTDQNKLLQEGERLVSSDLANTLDGLAHEGPRLFYEGEIGQALAQDAAQHGGHLTMDDLKAYQVFRRTPLEITYRGRTFLTNPAPSTGGLLIAFGLEMLEKVDLKAAGFGSPDHLEKILMAQMLTSQARRQASDPGPIDPGRFLSPAFVEQFRAHVARHPKALRGTTHLSCIDALGNAASLTVSNGEGCGSFVPGTGIMLNNMLGEEDINPDGFGNWPEDMRMSSMMSPTLILSEAGGSIALGSGGSNRIRTAILQVLVNLLDFGLDLGEAVEAPRLHYEKDTLNIEPGWSEDVYRSLAEAFPEMKIFNRPNLFFGGVHAVRYEAAKQAFLGAGDPRRGGVAQIVS